MRDWWKILGLVFLVGTLLAFAEPHDNTTGTTDRPSLNEGARSGSVINACRVGRPNLTPKPTVQLEPTKAPEPVTPTPETPRETVPPTPAKRTPPTEQEPKKETPSQSGPSEDEFKDTVINPSNVELSEVEKLIFHYTNLERIAQGLKPLEVDPDLQKTAREKSHNMAFAKTMSHDIQPLAGRAENIAWNQRTAEEVVRAWMNSEGHRKNILGDFKSMGVAAEDLGNGNYWTQQFN